MSDTTLYFVRHGETDYNRQRIVQGQGVDPSLNATGREQAEAVAHRLADVSFDAIYTSTLRRASETAEIIARQHSRVPVYRLKALEEMAWGCYEGIPFSPALKQIFEDLNARWLQGEYDYQIPDGESILDVQQSGRQAMDHILTRHTDETVLVVTHGRYLRVLLATLLDEYGLERMHEILHSNTGVNTLHRRDGRFEAELLNCTVHLEVPAFPPVN